MPPNVMSLEICALLGN